MKVLFLTDLHHRQNDFHIKYQLQFLKGLIPLIEEHGVDCIIGGGDYNNDRTVVNVEVQNLVKAAYMELRKKVKYFKVIAGNHDCYYTTTNKQNSLRLLFPFLSDNDIIDMKPQKFENLILIPRMNESNMTKMTNFVSAFNKPENFLFGHFEFSGMKMNGGHECTTTHLFKSDYSSYAQIYSGHFHGYQKKGNITYPGDPYQKDFGEVERKFLLILDTATGEETWIENDKAIYVKLSISPDMTDEAIKEKFNLFDVSGKHLKLYIDSEDSNYIDNVERILDTFSPYWVSTSTKHAQVSDTDINNVEEKDERSICTEFLDMMTYDNENMRTLVTDEFMRSYDKAKSEIPTEEN